ncbi:MAG: DNA-binding response regulator [Rhodanobacter sp.]
MSAVRLLWIDLCSQSPVDGLFQFVPSRHEALRVDRFETVAGAINQHHPECVSIEFDYPDQARLEVVTMLRRMAPEVPLLMFTEYHSEALAVWAFRSGVWDYRVKPISDEILARSIDMLFATVGSRGRHGRPGTGLPADLIEPAGHLQRPPSLSRKTGIAVAYIARYFDQDLKRGALADLCHVSPSEFSHAFKREQGITFEHFLLEYRVAKARDFLAEPHMAISQVAYSAGFSDASYFSRVFRRLTGVTASEYQRRVRLSETRSGTSI